MKRVEKRLLQLVTRAKYMSTIQIICTASCVHEAADARYARNCCSWSSCVNNSINIDNIYILKINTKGKHFYGLNK